MTERTTRCGKPTKRGTRCRMEKHSWLDRHCQLHHADGCWQHMSEPFKQAMRKRQAVQEAARRRYLAAEPACWSWPVPDDLASWEPPVEYTVGSGEYELPQEVIDDLMAVDRTPAGRAAALLSWWQDGRCAVCNVRGMHLCEDHDHESGLVRGMLCRSCNTREGLDCGTEGPFARYRERPPTSILGLEIRYWDPFTKGYARDRRSDLKRDPWDEQGNALIGIGL